MLPLDKDRAVGRVVSEARARWHVGLTDMNGPIIGSNSAVYTEPHESVLAAFMAALEEHQRLHDGANLDADYAYTIRPVHR